MLELDVQFKESSLRTVSSHNFTHELRAETLFMLTIFAGGNRESDSSHVNLTCSQLEVDPKELCVMCHATVCKHELTIKPFSMLTMPAG